MCTRQVLIHHQCQHEIGFRVQPCGVPNCFVSYVSDRVFTNKYRCEVPGCAWFGRK
ncbi:hypothetical protein QBC42DRAFT_268857 [Cladorrhinum samala]|uniref:Uncharacterized protein n=1 Tax=Cladorrhinum samala TaxID=585594 RepID=A0AAV9HPG4_9PEZI|nr:hypothetical protein QBC42DRAFT_268857 [Cladorrhinum samala]